MKPKKHHLHYGKKRGIHFLAFSAITVCLAGSAVTAAEVTYPYYRFNPTSLLSGNAVQVSEITFSLRGKKLNLNNSTGIGPVVNVSVTGGTNTDPDSNEGAMKLVDGNPGTKWFSGNLQPVVFSFGTPVTIDSFNFATSNDFPDRTPKTWVFQGSNDGEAWVDLQSQLGDYTAVYNRSHFTYQFGFTVTKPGLPGISNFGAAPAIVAAGTPVTATYTTANSPTSVTVDPGATAGNGTTTTFTPTASGVHTLTATNATGVATTQFNVKVVTPQTVNYQYIRYTPVKLRNESSANSTQLAEFEFYNGATKLTVQSVTNPGSNNPAAEIPARLIDGLTNNKYLDFNKFSPVIFDFGSPQTITGYQFYTGNDAPERAPVRWTIEGSSDGTNWTLIEDVNSDYPTDPTANKPSGILPFSYVAPTAPELTWAATSSSIWDTAAANFTGTQTTFTNGLSVLFDDTASSKNVTVAAEVAPRRVNINNSAGNNYTFDGAILNGSSTLSKSGDGNLTFATPTAHAGKISFLGGGISTNVGRSLGEAQNTEALVLEGGAQLNVVESQYSQRPLTVNNATINVAADKIFASGGRKSFTGTLTKDGPGTLAFYNYGNSFASTDQLLVINQGTVTFGTDRAGQAIFGPNRARFVVKPGATLRGSYSGAFGGNANDTNSGISQLRLEEGATLDLQGARQYLPIGVVDNGGVTQGRVVLKGATIYTAGQMETSLNNGTDDINTRCVLTTEESEQSSVITGGANGFLTSNVNMWVLDVANGPAPVDLSIQVRLEGYGIIKNGPGDLELTNNSTYTGYQNYNPETSPLWASPYGAVINNGSLVANNISTDSSQSVTGSSAVFIAAGAKLKGHGRVGGAVTSPGTIEPGSIASPTANLELGPTVLSGGLVIQVDGNDVVNPLGGYTRYGSDRITVSGDLNITGATLDVTAMGQGTTSAKYVIAKYSGDRIGTFAGTPTLPAGYELVYDDDFQEIRIEGEPTIPAGYAGWIAETDLTGEDAEASADPDGDGLPNLIEFIVGGNPEVSNLENAPSISRDPVNGDFIFVFGRTSDSAYLNPFVEYSTSLEADEWTEAPAGNVSVEPNGMSAGVDKVTVTLPSSLSNGGKLFARLKASL